jgi:hypothetical protein
MLKGPLVDEYISDGRRLIESLDQSGLSVRSAFWFFDPSASRWRLVIHFPQIDTVAHNLAYGMVQRVMMFMHLSFELNDIALQSSYSELIAAIRPLLSGEPEWQIPGPILSNGIQIQGAHVYRMTA